MAIGTENLPPGIKGECGDAFDVRTMNYADLRKVMEIEERAYTHPWTIGIFRDCIRVGYNCWVVLDDDRIVGYGVIMLAAGEAHILNICVDPDYQGRGMGRFLLRHLISRCAKNDIDMVILEVRRSNQVAIQLYQSEGFHELGVRKGYYPDHEGREDAIIFARYISPVS